MASIGAPLGCGHTLTPNTEPWVAVPDPSLCGHLFYIRFTDGSTLLARALDTGPFSNHCVSQPDGDCYPILLDIPAQHSPFPGLSAEIELVLDITAEASHVH